MYDKSSIIKRNNLYSLSKNFSYCIKDCYDEYNKIILNACFSYSISLDNASTKKKNIITDALNSIDFSLLSSFWGKIRSIYYVNNWIYTTNHKRIAVNYFWFVILSGIVGMVLATLIRLEFAYPGVGVFVGDSLQYLSLASAHGVVMVFFMIMPLLFGAFANFLLPTQLGVHDVAFPRLNSAAFWFLPGGLLMLCQLVCVDRRYQRMNCFNIREIQAILKKRFFSDLINVHEHREHLNNSILGLRFKTPHINAILNNTNIFYNYGLEVNSKIRNQKYTDIDLLKNLNTFKLKNVPTFTSFFENNNLFIFNKMYFVIIAFFSNSFFFTNKFNNIFSFHEFDIFIKKNITTFNDNFYTNFLNLLNYISPQHLFSQLLHFFYSAFPLFLFNSFFKIGNIVFSYFFFFISFQIKFLNEFSWISIFSLITSSLSEYFFNSSFLIINFKNKMKFYFNIFFYNILNYENFFLFNFLNFSLFNFFKNFSMAKIFFLINNTVYFFVFNFLTFAKDVVKLFLNLMFSLQNYPIFNYYLFSYFQETYSFYYLFSNKFINFKSKYFNNNSFDSYIKYSNEETSNNYRYWRFSNPMFKYDYKSGDYLPKFVKETYTHLFTTGTDLSGITKLPSWFFSEKYKELIELDFNFFFNTTKKKIRINKTTYYLNEKNHFGTTEGFYNIFYANFSNNYVFNKNFLNLNILNQKFYKFFHTSSMQQRIYGNWRQLKFTREAWRCKLLAARHQKTLFKRYLNEDGVFWSIERNAKDLLPGWAMITPFSSRTRFTAIGKTDIGLIGVLLVLNSSIISAANFLVTYRYLSTLNNRKMRDARAFFTEGVMVASWMMVTANPMLVIGIIMLLSDRHWQTSFFDYSGGGDTVLFQHMFWFFGHPEVYIIIIPTFGFTNTILSYYLKKRVSARASLMYSMYTIAFLGFFVWGHHMYMVGLAHTTRMLFSTLTVMISVPAATKIMHWCVTIVNSSFATELPLLFVITFIFFFVSGGISGMAVAHTGMDVLFHDTFYVIGHFHVMLAGAGMFASFGAFYFYFPAIFGVKYSRIYAYLHYSYYLIGQLMTVIPMFWLGYAGMPRRVLDYPSSFGGWHSVISAGHMLSVAGLMAFFIMIFDSLRQGKSAIRNTFGISRYNTRLNFYIYEIAFLIYSQQKGGFFFKFNKPYSIKLKKYNFNNFEPLETILITYSFSHKNK